MTQITFAIGTFAIGTFDGDGVGGDVGGGGGGYNLYRLCIIYINSV